MRNSRNPLWVRSDDTPRDGSWILDRIIPKQVKQKYMRPADPPTVPCSTCGKPTTSCGTKKCDCCWEVEARLPEYLSTPGAVPGSPRCGSATGAGAVDRAVDAMPADRTVIKH